MALQLSQLRDGITSNVDKWLGRSPPTWSDQLYNTAGRSYSVALGHAGSLLSLPMTVLSFLAIPFFGGTSTSINLLFFYLTWSALIWTHSPRTIELYGTLALKSMLYLVPSLAFLGFDYFLPSASASIKADGRRSLPSRLGQTRLLHITGWAIFNVLFGVFLQAAIDILLPTLGLRSALRVTMAVPLPWTMARQILFILAARGILHYVIHRFVLHAPANSPYPAFATLSKLHRSWAHSTPLVFSIMAAYDHPVCYLLNHWIPLYVPAAFSRLHILTFLVLVAITSLENLFVYSGYSALPSAIMLPGMARRVERHYATRGKGNFGHWGVLDFVCRSMAGGEGEEGEDRDVMDDLKDEAQKRDVRRRVSDAWDGVGSKLKKRAGKKGRKEEVVEDSEEADEEEEQEDADFEEEEEDAPRKKSNGNAAPVKRRSARRS